MHCPSLQVNSPSLHPVSFKRLLYDSPLVLQVLLSFAMVQLCEPRAKEEKAASDIAVVFVVCCVSICQEEIVSIYFIMLFLRPRSSTLPDP